MANDKNLEERIFTIAYDNACNDPEYLELLKKAVFYGEKIMNILGPDGILFLKYQQATCQAKSIRLKGAYKLGMDDANASQNAQQNI